MIDKLPTASELDEGLLTEMAEHARRAQQAAEVPLNDNEVELILAGVLPGGRVQCEHCQWFAVERQDGPHMQARLQDHLTTQHPRIGGKAGGARTA